MKEKHFYDKTDWLKGPWLEEPDYRAWIDKETNYPCVARRNLTGAWCGFVGIDHEHPLYQADAKEEEMVFIDVHGMVTYTSWNTEEDREFYPGRRLWWVGFDCMHDSDMCPAFLDETKKKKKSDKIAVYRDLNYVMEQIELLAAHLSMFDSRFFA
jgi:hypothetical protein